MTPGELRVLELARRYTRLRHEAFERATEGTQQDADNRARVVQQTVEELLDALLELPPGRHPNDVGWRIRLNQ
jgi:hypothetical protein